MCDRRTHDFNYSQTALVNFFRTQAEAKTYTILARTFSNRAFHLSVEISYHSVLVVNGRSLTSSRALSVGDSSPEWVEKANKKIEVDSEPGREHAWEMLLSHII